jgi:hypothetical protein
MPNLVNLFNNEKKRFAAETKEQIPDGKQEKLLLTLATSFGYIYSIWIMFELVENPLEL